MAARVAVVVGTRPEAIKVAPVALALQASPVFEPLVVSTGQHRELVAQMLAGFGIAPDVDLDVMAHGQSLGDVTARVVTRMAPVLAERRPRAVLVQGDTTTAMAAALAAFYARVPVVHLEAGLRTGDRWSPYPEEVNRRMITQLASLHLAPTEVTRQNLVAEGVDPLTAVVTGNTVIDALLATVAASPPYGDARLEALCAGDHRILLVTAHRRESWDGGLAGVATALAELVERVDDLHVVFPVHPNPVVVDAVTTILTGRPRVHLIAPLAYGPFARLMARADLILTDSGGIQEEGPALGTPTLVARETTERPEAVAAGGTRLVGTEPSRIVDEVVGLLGDPLAYRAMAGAPSPYGDGRAAGRVVAAMAELLGVVPADGPEPSNGSVLRSEADGGAPGTTDEEPNAATDAAA